MARVKKYLVDLRPYSTSYVTFGDGAKGKIKGIGKLICLGFSRLDDVFLVEGLTTNLISINQLCDLGLNVYFYKSECMVSSTNQDVLMKGKRCKDNCCIWVPQNKIQPSTCLISKEDEVKLWHQILGHINLKRLKKIISKEDIKGLPS